MKRVEKLKHEARTCASWRGHTLSKFTRGGFWKDTWSAACSQCACVVIVEDFPGHDIVGDAVAINCPKGTQRKG